MGTVWSMRPLPTWRSSMNSVTSPPVAGFGASALNSMPHLDVAGRKCLLGDLLEDEHAHHRVGVGELAVLDVEGEAAEVVGLGDDHALGATLGDQQVGGDRVGAVVDARDHPGQHVLHVAAELELRLRRDRGQHAEEGGQRREQRQHLVPLGLLPRTGP